jgi:LysR family transcriptional regulator, low CO2-responsive transcriptional regulator
MTLHQLRVFVKVAEMQSFTDAAKMLGLTQPSVSSLIQGLVDEVQYELFERHGIKISLTPEGTVFVRRARDALAIIDGTKEEIEELHGLKKGRVVVGGSPIPAASFLPVMVQKFKNEHPGVQVVLKIQSNSSLERQLLERELDLALVSWAPHSPLLRSESYLEEQIVAIAPPNHPLVRKRGVTLRMLAKEPLISSDSGIQTRDMVEQRFARKGVAFVPTIQISAQIGARDAIRNAVASGLGIGFIARCHVIADVEAGRVKILNVPELNLKRIIYIVTHRNRQMAPLVHAFKTFLHEHKEPA